jgi:glucokinase
MEQQYKPTGLQQQAAAARGHVIGIDIGGTSLRIALADPAGVILARWLASTAGTNNAQSVIDLIVEGVNDLLRQTALPRSVLRAAAAGAPGITDINTGVVIATSYLLGWRDIPLREMLESALGVPVAVDNDVNLAALGESWGGAAQGVRDFVFLAVGTGIGAGIVLHRTLFHGMRWTAGEVGYMMVPGVAEEPVRQDDPGPLESLAGGEGIRARWQNIWDPARTTLPKNSTAIQIFDQAEHSGEPLAQDVLQQSARAIAYTAYNMFLILSCPLFVLGGSVGLHPALLNAARRVLQQMNTRAVPELALSTLGADAQLMGAIRLALDTAQAASRTEPVAATRAGGNPAAAIVPPSRDGANLSRATVPGETDIHLTLEEPS